MSWFCGTDETRTDMSNGVQRTMSAIKRHCIALDSYSNLTTQANHSQKKHRKFLQRATYFSSGFPLILNVGFRFFFLISFTTLASFARHFGASQNFCDEAMKNKERECMWFQKWVFHASVKLYCH